MSKCIHFVCPSKQQVRQICHGIMLRITLDALMLCSLQPLRVNAQPSSWDVACYMCTLALDCVRTYFLYMKPTLSSNLSISPLFTNLLMLSVLIFYFFPRLCMGRTWVESIPAYSPETNPLDDSLLLIDYLLRAITEQALEPFVMYFSQPRKEQTDLLSKSLVDRLG